MRRDAVTREVLSLFVGVATRFYSEYDAAAEANGLTGAQARLLAYVAGGPAPMNQIAALLRCEPSNITGLVDRLEARGLVTRQPSPADRRVKLIAATAEGAQLSAKVWAGLDFAAEPLAALGEDERLTLRDFLRRLAGTAPGSGPGAAAAPAAPGEPARTASASRSR
jgi:DNA-binding MarR family transcriptional regulator